MPISEDQKRQALREFVKSFYVSPNATANLDSEDIKASVGDLVLFIESNAAAINNAIPEPARSKATNQEKRYLLALAAIKLAGL